MFYRLLRKTIAKAQPIFVRKEKHASTLPLSCIKMSKEMIHFHKSLPRLPVPPLHSSLEVYLRSVRPFLTDEEYHNTCKIVKEFGAPDGLGVKLHSALIEKSNCSENWLREWWVNYGYLSVRNTLLTDSSCGIVGNFQDFDSSESHLRYSAKIIAGLLDFKRHFYSSELDADVMGGQPLDMVQYYDMFAGCRIPGSPLDSHLFTYLEDEPPKHIVVAHNNHFFSCEVYDNYGKPLSEDQLFAQFKSVVHQSQEPQQPIGILTTLNRDKWFKAYEHLRKNDPINANSINAIQKSILVLCLDKPIVNNDLQNRRSHLASHFIHGGGAEENSGNRWFDNCLQVIINRDGTFGFTFEHSVSDGYIFVKIEQHLYDYMKRTKRNETSSISAPLPKPLKFNISRKSVEHIEEAKKDLKSVVDDLDMRCFIFDKYGTNFIKSQKMSSDSFIQMALQLAFYKIHGEPSATYESAATRKFLLGRTDVIRSTSVESLDFCKKMVDQSTSLSTRTGALRNSINTHKEYSYQAMNGMAIDRLLLGLKLIALESGMSMPALFEDRGFTKSTYFRLSTSQVDFKYGTFGGYGPLVRDGYSCCYNPKPTSIIFPIGASNSCQKTSSRDFSKALAEALTEMYDVITKSQI